MALSTNNTPPEISCAGGCGVKTATPEAMGWALLPITGRYRCGACTRALEAVGREAPLKDDGDSFAAAVT